MNKIIAMLTACMLVFPCFSCSEKKQDEDITEDVSETVETAETDGTPDTGDTIVERGFREYTNDDFQTINVSLTYPDKEAPVRMTKYELPDYDFGERMSPCKTISDPSENDPDKVVMEGEYNKENSMYMKHKDEPEKGKIAAAVMNGNRMYLIVNYDKFCMYGHEWAVFSYDTETKEMKEVYTYSDPEYFSLGSYNIRIVNDKLILCRYTVEGTFGLEGHDIQVIDLVNGTSKEILSTDQMFYVSVNGGDTIQITLINQRITGETNFSVIEYNVETDEQRSVCDKVASSPECFLMSDIGAYMVNNYSKGCQLVTDNYIINTGIKTLGRTSVSENDTISTLSIIYASENKAIIQKDITQISSYAPDADRQTFLHTYDFEKMEHYVTELNGKMHEFVSYNGDIIMVGSMYSGAEDIYYIKPELGLAFKMAEKMDIAYGCRNGRSMELNEVSPEVINKDPNYMVQYDYPTALWCIEDKE